MIHWDTGLGLIVLAFALGRWWEEWQQKKQARSDMVPLRWDNDTLMITKEQRPRVVRSVDLILH